VRCSCRIRPPVTRRRNQSDSSRVEESGEWTLESQLLVPFANRPCASSDRREREYFATTLPEPFARIGRNRQIERERTGALRRR
jgi:hypothetical protein